MFFPALCLILISVFLFASGATSTSSCDGYPYLYVTVHDEIQNVLKYSRNGCLLSESVLQSGPPLNKNSELRSIIIHSYNAQDALFVADSKNEISSVYIYGPCDSSGQRSYITTVLSNDPDAVHPYGIGFDADNNIYISYQHTDNVIRLKYSNSLNIPVSTNSTYEFFPYQPDLPTGYPNGTFYQFGKPGVHKSSEQGVRSVVGVYSNKTLSTEIWIANEDINSITILSENDANIINTINITSPIGLYYSKEYHLVFAGSKDSTQGSLVAYDASTYKLMKTFAYKLLTHPAGMVTYNDILYVNEQDLNQILSFNITSENFISVIVENPPGVLESMELCIDSRC